MHAIFVTNNTATLLYDAECMPEPLQSGQIVHSARKRVETDECYANKFEYVHVFTEINKLKRIISEPLA